MVACARHELSPPKPRLPLRTPAAGHHRPQVSPPPATPAAAMRPCRHRHGHRRPPSTVAGVARDEIHRDQRSSPSGHSPDPNGQCHHRDQSSKPASTTMSANGATSSWAPSHRARGGGWGDVKRPGATRPSPRPCRPPAKCVIFGGARARSRRLRHRISPIPSKTRRFKKN